MIFKIYYIQPALLGPLAQWSRHLDRCREMGFSHLCISPPFRPAASGNVFDVADHDAAHRVFGNDDPDAVLASLAEACRARDLTLLLDLVVDRLASEHPLVSRNRSWFRLPSDFDDDLPDPRRPATNRRHAQARLEDAPVIEGLGSWWAERLRHWAKLGVGGFRCLRTDSVPAALWRSLSRKSERPLLAWTPGIPRHRLEGLRGAGFAAVFSSSAWWDGRSSWFAEEHEALSLIAPVVATVEPLFGPRRDGSRDHARALNIAASTGAGFLMPIGFERALTRALDPTDMDPEEFDRDWQESAVDLMSDVAAAAALADRLAEFAGGEMRVLVNGASPVTALLRADASDVRHAENAALILINGDLDQTHPTPIDSVLPASAGASFGAFEPMPGSEDLALPLAPGAVRILGAKPLKPVRRRPAAARAAVLKAAQTPRIVIEKVTPSVDGGRFPAKCVIGDTVTIGASIYADGHDLLAAEIVWKAADETDWHRAPLEFLGNDRWQARITFARVGRHSLAVDAWWDAFGTYRRELALKRKAGAGISLELEEGRRLLDEAAAASKGRTKTALRDLVKSMAKQGEDFCADCLLSAEAAAAMAAAEARPFLVRSEVLPIEAERPQAAFASWYEMFPRSATDDPERHGTFADVIARLPDIRAMGFDVLYFPPIHPIGRTNRKGRNNSLKAEPDDIGSPYAIGSKDGGHDAIHPELGTAEDFRALIRAAREHGLEIALDFAIQCSPDHPWIKEHPGWFRWRPDGSIRFAENPPKKYEDIVNVDFFAEDAVPELWLALRDIVLHWIAEGVRIFRVDNPHTKPLTFWEWMIADVRARHPDAIFLSEAFTRPALMYRLAKIGFSQSYTYFTWRNSKQELTDYLTELTTTEVKDYFRPHFFVNTPDINPVFLQTAGRGGFLIRAALAATLSGLWGLYSGFEQCEAAPVPGKEEYLDSEKYEIRVRDPRSPGDIVEEITALNRIRKSNPALQTHLGLRFYQALNDRVLVYGKAREPLTDMILIAVSLDPHQVQEASFEIPLWEWGLGDDRSVAVEDLMRGHRFVWHGKIQRVRLDPRDLPFAIWRIAPEAHP